MPNWVIRVGFCHGFFPGGKGQLTILGARTGGSYGGLTGTLRVCSSMANSATKIKIKNKIMVLFSVKCGVLKVVVRTKEPKCPKTAPRTLRVLLAVAVQQVFLYYP